MKTKAGDDIYITKREKEIIVLISLGFTTKQISISLFISELTVKTHRHNLLKKLKAKNSVELVNMSIRKRII